MALSDRNPDGRKGARWCFYGDLLALSLTLVLLAALALDSFNAGYRTWHALQDPTYLFARDAILYRMLGEALALGVCLAWLGYRTVRHGYRSIVAAT